MRPIALPLILAAALAGTAAHAQATDPYSRYGTAPPAGAYAPPGYGDQGGYADQGGGYGDEDQGPPPGYGNAPPPPGGTSYRDDERWSAQDDYGSADARGESARGASGWQGRGGPAPGTRVHSPRTRAYADRIARWRARADACEAGDLRACQGPDN